MNMVHQGFDRRTQDVKDRVQARLGALSLIIWLVVAFGIVMAFDLAHAERQSRILMAGGVAFLVAAAPWVSYPYLLRRALEREKSKEQASS